MIIMGAYLVEEQIDQFRGFFVQSNHHIQNIKPGKNPIAFRDMTPESITTALFST